MQLFNLPRLSGLKRRKENASVKKVTKNILKISISSYLGKAHCRQEILKLKPKIVEVQERVDEYNKKFVQDIEKDKFLRRNYKKRLEDHSEKIEESIKKEYLELDVKVAETANQEGLKKDLKELERLQKLRKMLAESELIRR